MYEENTIMEATTDEELETLAQLEEADLDDEFDENEDDYEVVDLEDSKKTSSLGKTILKVAAGAGVAAVGYGIYKVKKAGGIKNALTAMETKRLQKSMEKNQKKLDKLTARLVSTSEENALSTEPEVVEVIENVEVVEEPKKGKTKKTK